MPYLLDTNAVIALMKGHPAVKTHVRQVGRRQLRICATVEAERSLSGCQACDVRIG